MIGCPRWQSTWSPAGTASLALAIERAPRETITVPVRGLQISFACVVGSKGRCPSLG
jgi:hypothetical protein